MVEKESKNDDAVEAVKKDDDCAEVKDRLLRLAAEFDNYKKRVAKDIDASEEKGIAEVMTALLPTVDEFELAMKALDKNDEHYKGIGLIFSNLMTTLKGFGLTEIKSSGKYDPYKHEPVLVKDADEDDGTIIEVIRKGYTFNNIMLRPASVIISKKTDKNEKEKKGE